MSKEIKCGLCQNFTPADISDESCEGACSNWEQAVKNGTTHEKVAIYSNQLGGIPFFADMTRDCNKFEVIL